MHMATAKKPSKRKSSNSKSTPPPSDEEAMSRYQEVFEQIARFVSLIQDGEEELRDAEANLADTKSKYEAAKQVVASIRELRDGAKHGLFRYLSPADGSDILPLFDRMEPTNEKVHGAYSTEWRLEPIAALRLSLPVQMALTDNEIMLVGQLQDRVLANAEGWWENLPGLSLGAASAIVDKLNDFIFDRSTK